jgi:asparagine synthase (glutamine-hydrolysing)
VIWEPSRFGFVYDLVRAYWRTGDEVYAELFWTLVESWRAQNPPQSGVNWKCGQEISFRVMAWCFGLSGFLDAPATIAPRVANLAQMIAVSGHRIEANLSYALSQCNNHGISEAMGLWTIGLLFPELRGAARWRDLGRQHLEALGRNLIYDDGSFTQHSVNYHRLMLHSYLWSLRLGDVNGQPLSSELKARVGKAGAFLYQIQDDLTGQAPNYGSNDGALILPLNDCDFQDLRPAVQATHYLSTGYRCYDDGPWDEDLLWIFGPDAVSAPVGASARADLHAEVGGYHTLRSQTGFALVRCASFRHRPGHADMLHVDIWWKGQNVAVDPGTYSYNAAPPWDKSLSGTAYHNTVTVDGLDQMESASRFLWLPWVRGRARAYLRSSSGYLAYWEGEHDGYERLAQPATHRRAIIQLGDEHWLVLDRMRSHAPHRYRLHWLLPDEPHVWDPRAGCVRLETPRGEYLVQMGSTSACRELDLVRCDDMSPRGWRSLYYGYREPAISVVVSQESSAGDFWSLMGPLASVPIVTPSELQIVAETWVAQVTLEPGDGVPLVRSVRLEGSIEETLEVAA